MERRIFFKYLVIMITIINFSMTKAQQYSTSHQSPQLFKNNRSVTRNLLINVFAHSEPASETNPANTNNIITAFNSSYPQTYPTIYSQGVKYSTNGGLTWTTIDTLPKANNKGYASDPGIAFSSNGTAYVSYVAYGSGQDEVRYNSSTNGGASWSNPVTVYTAQNGFGVDRSNICIDNDALSPYKDRLYFAWSNASSGFLTNGINFITPSETGMKQISNDVGWGVDMAVDVNHNLYVVWCDFNDNLRMNRSTNGGKDWGTPVTVKSGLTNPIVIGEIRARYYPSIDIDKSSLHNNRIYISYHSGSQSDVDVFTTYSDDGVNWSLPKQVNDDKNQGNSNGKSQWFPWITVNKEGIVHVTFYDNRNGSTTTNVQTFVAASFDGGDTYVNTAVTDLFTLSPIPGLADGYAGDYLAVTNGRISALSLWTQPSANNAYDILSSPQVTGKFINQIAGQNAGGTFSINSNVVTSNTNVSLLSGAGIFEKTLGYNSSNRDRFPNYQDGATHKHNNWNGNTVNYLFKNNFAVPKSTTVQTQNALYVPLNHLAVTTSLEFAVSGGSLQFNDPWYLNNNSTQGNNFGALIAVPLTQNNGITGAYNQTSGGVFLNQNPVLNNPSIPYYSVRAPLTQDISLSQTGRIHKFYFRNWSTSNAQIQQIGSSPTGYDQKAVVFTSSNATVTANYKGTQLSSDGTAFTNNSQRKIVRTANGWQHMVYESMGHVWYEISTDNGVTWSLVSPVLGGGGNPGPLDNGSGKCPSICRITNPNVSNAIAIVFQQKVGSNSYEIVLLTYILYNGQWIRNSSTQVWSEPIDQYSVNANPNIASSPSGYAVVTWERKTAISTNSPAGIYYSLGILDGTGLYINNPNRVLPTPVYLQGTNNNSINTAISSNDIIDAKYCIAWQQYVNATTGSIKSTNLFYNYGSNTTVQDPITPITVSNASYLNNYKASTVTLPDGSSRIAWISNQAGGGDGYSLYAFVKNMSTSVINQFGLGYRSASINMTDNGSSIYLALSKNWSNTWTNHFIQLGAGTLKTLNTAGSEVQLSNGAAVSNMYVSAFYPFTSPYYFRTSNNLGSFGKANSSFIGRGRGFSISKDDADISYTIGDITLDGKSIDFVKMDDNLNYNNIERLNNTILTEPFKAESNSELSFSEILSISDTLSILKLLSKKGFLNYKIELLDEAAGKVITAIKKSALDQKTLLPSNIKCSSLNMEAVSGKLLRLRVSLETNIENAEKALVERYSEESYSSLGKFAVEKLTLEDVSVIKDYSLEQNYPNPFNPKTTIIYQLPKDGYVTLKVYDILGKEIAALVKEYKSQGRYSVEFDASNLASGTYIYEIRVNDYSAFKKLMVLK